MEEYKIKYNNLLKKEKQAADWLDHTARTSEEIEKHLPTYEKILASLNMMIDKYSISGNEILNDFADVR